MRIRSIRPEFWRSEDIEALDVFSRLLFIGLWSYVDDNGVGLDRVSNIAADLFAGDLSREAPETLARVSDGLNALEKGGQLSRYESGGRHYLHVTSWKKHQRVDKPAGERYPLPPDALTSGSGDPRETLANGFGTRLDDHATPSGLEKRRRGEGEERNRDTSRARSAPLSESWQPSKEDIDWALRSRPDIDHQRAHDTFMTHYLGNGAKQKDWGATWRTWMSRERITDGLGTPAPPASVAAPPRELPEWCGECDEIDRRYETDAGAVAKCPRCHPDVAGRF